jgi:integrase
MSLKDAGAARDEARKLLGKGGVDPGAARRSEKQQSAIAAADNFEGIAREWLDLQSNKLAPVTMAKAKWILETFIFPHLGANAISGIQSPDILAVLRRIETKGLHETAHRAKSRCSHIFRYAVATGRAKRDPTADLRGVLAPVVTKSHAVITDPQAIAQLLRAIDGYTGGESTRAALKLAPMWFVRPRELRMAEWSEFDLDEAIWRIPAERMKMGEAHIVTARTLFCSVCASWRSMRSGAQPISLSRVDASARKPCPVISSPE